MRALVMKDCYTLWKQLRIFIVVMLVIVVFNGSFGNVFIVVWAAMLPYTAMAYDERSKWDQLAAMMPYSVRDLVLSKYVLGWLCIGAAALFALLVQLAARLLRLPFAALSPSSNLLGFCSALCILALIFPLMFRFGVERGRLVMFLILVLVCGTAGAIGFIAIDISANQQGFAFQGAILVGLIIAAVVLTAISIPLSIRLYPHRTY